MKLRRASIDRYLKKFSDTLGFGVGDLVTYAPTGYKILGLVVDIDPKIRKIYVDWAGIGNVHQHDAEELQISPLQETSVKNSMGVKNVSRIASRVVGDVVTTEFLSSELSDLLNKQFAAEISNSAFYFVCASFLENMGLPGFALFFKHQGDDEAEHAMKVYEFLVDAGENVRFPVLREQPIPQDVKNIVRAGLIKEVETTKNWQIISESAKRGYNVAAVELCQWFMKEQMEEEDVFAKINQKVLASPMNGGLEIIDRNLLEDYKKEDAAPSLFCRRGQSDANAE